MLRNEAQTRHDLIDPALHAKGWKGCIRVEEMLPPIDIVAGEGRRRQFAISILFTQMAGRVTRVAAGLGKLMFLIFDYTGATALFGVGFITAPLLEVEEPGTGNPQPPKLFQRTHAKATATAATSAKSSSSKSRNSKNSASPSSRKRRSRLANPTIGLNLWMAPRDGCHQIRPN